jgi:uncharacterized protein
MLEKVTRYDFPYWFCMENEVNCSLSKSRMFFYGKIYLSMVLRGVLNLKYPTAYIKYLAHFHGDHDYFECHEILEDYWKQTEKGNRESIWVGLIQLAVAQYHHRRGNLVGANKLINKSIQNLKEKRIELNSLGINPHDLFILLNQLQRKMNVGKLYESIDLPILDDRLISICIIECEKLGFQWCQKNFNPNDYIINRHKLRDRSGIELEKSLAKINRLKDLPKKECVHG